jgi:hypothetical protein
LAVNTPTVTREVVSVFVRFSCAASSEGHVAVRLDLQVTKAAYLLPTSLIQTLGCFANGFCIGTRLASIDEWPFGIVVKAPQPFDLRTVTG